MAILLVLCDSADAERLQAAFEEYGESFRLSRSSYLLHSQRRRDEVLNNLRRLPRLVSPESLFAIRLQQPYIGPISADVNVWLRRMAEKDSAGHEDNP